ncbi:MAG: ATP-binding cassette domain-containing protein, partial [Solirubrobacterales bacterium]
MAAPRNLVNLKTVSKSYSSRPILTDITLGVNADERIGIVGTNGDGKTTLLRLISGVEHPDGGEVTRSRATTVGFLDQRDLLPAEHTVREVLIGEMADHEWAGEARIRDILDGLLGGVDVGRFPDGFDTKLGPLSGGEKRRIALAKVLIDGPELLLLDEPTNHLDVEGVDWLASHLNARSGSLLVVTH